MFIIAEFGLQMLLSGHYSVRKIKRGKVVSLSEYCWGKHNKIYI